jgi:hypothetical protein
VGCPKGGERGDILSAVSVLFGIGKGSIGLAVDMCFLCIIVDSLTRLCNGNTLQEGQLKRSHVQRGGGWGAEGR